MAPLAKLGTIPGWSFRGRCQLCASRSLVTLFENVLLPDRSGGTPVWKGYMCTRYTIVVGVVECSGSI